MVRNGLVWREGPRESEGKELVDWSMLVALAELVRTVRHLWESEGWVNIRSLAAIVEFGGGMTEAGRL